MFTVFEFTVVVDPLHRKGFPPTITINLVVVSAPVVIKPLEGLYVDPVSTSIPLFPLEKSTKES